MMNRFPTDNFHRRARVSPSPAFLWLVVGGLLLAACSSSTHTTTPTTAAPPTTIPASTTTVVVPTTATPPAATTTTVATPTTVAPTSAFATVSGYYYGGTADAGYLYLRSDGSSRYRYPDDQACQSCSTATAPIAYVDFSLTSLVAQPGGAPGNYRATGRITAESDPTTGAQLAGPVGSSVTVAIGPVGSATLSFLSPNNVLMMPASQG